MTDGRPRADANQSDSNYLLKFRQLICLDEAISGCLRRLAALLDRFVAGRDDRTTLSGGRFPRALPCRG